MGEKKDLDTQVQEIMANSPLQVIESINGITGKIENIEKSLEQVKENLQYFKALKRKLYKELDAENNVFVFNPETEGMEWTPLKKLLDSQNESKKPKTTSKKEKED